MASARTPAGLTGLRFTMNHTKPALPYTRWASLIPDEQWKVFAMARDAAQGVGVPFLLGGAIGMACYTGRWRNTKDLDFFVRPRHHEAMVRALRDAGFEDYFSQQQYDRSWIFRGFREGVILDVIWTLPNHRVDVDDDWFQHARTVHIHREPYQAIPLEELVRIKLYVMQRERCDWVDVLNLLAAGIDQVDWNHLVARMDRDLPLLQSVLTLFTWLAPGRAATIPEAVRTRFALPKVETHDPFATEERRVRLLDSRPWYALFQPEDQPLER